MDGEHSHNHSVYDELICHLPYAIFSVAFGLTILSFISVLLIGSSDPRIIKKGAKALFHSFHFMHIVFAATGTIITFRRFSKSIVKATIFGIISPAIFCMLSDAVLPYLGGRMLGIPMHFHICLLSNPLRVLPFLFVGVLNGLVMSKHHSSKQWLYSISSHATHIFISSLASVFYLVSHGFTKWDAHIGNIFLFLIIAVVVPCTLSDVVAPMAVARADKKDEKHST